MQTVCNINTIQINKRKKTLIVSIIVYVVSLFLVLLQPWQLAWYLCFFISLFIAFISYYQVTEKFCVRFAFSELQSVGKESEIKKIEDAQKNKQYKIFALKIIAKSFLYAAAVTIVTFALFAL